MYFFDIFAFLVAKQRRQTIDSLISDELVASIIICGTFFMVIRTIMGFTKDISELRPKLIQLENTLDRMRTTLTDSKELVGNLSQEVEPIQDLEGKMRAHYEIMQDIQLEDEKKRLAAEAEAEAETGRKMRTGRKQIGGRK